MTEKLCHDILSSGVTELVWSIDAPEKALYEKIRLRGKFDNRRHLLNTYVFGTWRST